MVTRLGDRAGIWAQVSSASICLLRWRTHVLVQYKKCLFCEILKLSSTGIGFLEENELLDVILLNQELREFAKESFSALRLPSSPLFLRRWKSLLDQGLQFTQDFTRPETWAPSVGKKIYHFLVVVTSGLDDLTDELRNVSGPLGQVELSIKLTFGLRK